MPDAVVQVAPDAAALLQVCPVYAFQQEPGERLGGQPERPDHHVVEPEREVDDAGGVEARDAAHHHFEQHPGGS